VKDRHVLHLLRLASLGAVMAVPALAQDSSFYHYGITAGQSSTDTDAAGVAQACCQA
jgi:hypothetical protein